jgi:multiple sugar transport system substrate-binding protein
MFAKGTTRRQLLGRAAGGAALLGLPGALAGCGSDDRVKVARGGDPWRRYAGTELNFISENTAPTLAIGANLAEFERLTGIRVKITQLELSALVQKVALDFGSGLGSYQVVYADPYQILAPYREALAPLNAFQADEDLPSVEDMGDFFPTQLDAAGKFEDPETIYALPYDAPTMIWMYRRDLFDKHGDRMEQDLGFGVMPSLDSTWDQYLQMATWFGKNAKDDVPYGTLHMAKQHDALMNDFSNVLWSFGGDYFKDGEKVGRMGSRDPGESLLTTEPSLRAAEFYQRLLKVAHPSSLGWDWTGAGEGFKAGQAAMAPLWHEDAAGVEDSALKGKVGFAPLPKGPARRSDMYGGTGLGINATASADAQKAAWLFVVWATQKKTQLENLKSEVGGGTPTLQSVYELPEVVDARERPSKIPNILTYGAIEQAWKPENIGLRPKIPAWNECDTRMFTALSKMLASGGDPQTYMQQAKDGMEQAIENAKALA